MKLLLDPLNRFYSAQSPSVFRHTHFPPEKENNVDTMERQTYFYNLTVSIFM